jgi:ribosomal protein S19
MTIYQKTQAEKTKQKEQQIKKDTRNIEIYPSLSQKNIKKSI